MNKSIMRILNYTQEQYEADMRKEGEVAANYGFMSWRHDIHLLLKPFYYSMKARLSRLDTKKGYLVLDESFIDTSDKIRG